MQLKSLNANKSNDVSQFAYARSNLSLPPDAVRADRGDEQVDRPWLPQGRRRHCQPCRHLSTMQSSATCSISSLVPSLITTAFITNTKKATPAPEKKKFIILTFVIVSILPTHFCRSLPANQFHCGVASY